MSCADLCETVRGECFDDVCVCRNLYFGDNCSQSYFDTEEKEFWGIFWFYQALSLIIYIALFVLATLITRSVYRSVGIKNVAGACLASVYGALTLRLISILVDPDNSRAIFPKWLDNLLFTLTLLFVITGCLFIEFFWMELIIATGLQSTLPLKRLVPWSIGIGIGWFVLFFGVALWQSITATDIGGSILALVIAFAIIFLLAVTVYLGVKTRQSIKTKWSGPDSGQRQFQKSNLLLKKVVGYSIGMSVLLLAALLTSTLQSILYPQNYWYCVFQLLAQLEMGGMLLCVLLFFWRRNRPKSRSSKRASISTTAEEKRKTLPLESGNASHNATMRDGSSVSEKSVKTTESLEYPGSGSESPLPLRQKQQQQLEQKAEGKETQTPPTSPTQEQTPVTQIQTVVVEENQEAANNV